MDFIDIRGASGTAYRFRSLPQSGVHPPIAGNYVLIAARTRALVGFGALDDLSQAPSLLNAYASGAELFTRFNISRRDRESEHADMALQHPGLGHSASAAFAGEAA